MSRISEKLASLHITAWNMVVILLWLIWGFILAGLDAYTAGFKAMNSMLIRDWLTSPDPNSNLLKFWFIGICILMTILGINLIFCSWEKIYKIIRVRFSGSKLYMLIVHALFGFVALFHLCGFMFGYEQNNIRLGEGVNAVLTNGYEIKVNKIAFAGDASALDKSYHQITNATFDYKASYVEVVLIKDGRELKTDNLRIFKPLKYGDVRVTLYNFISPSKDKDAEQGEKVVPWVRLTFTKNPVLDAFFFIYPLMIAGILIHLILTWRSTATNRADM